MKKTTIKKKSLFDHIKEITSVQNPNYWETLSEDDKKTWSNYMVHRFLSMKMEWIEVVNELQKYNTPEFCIDGTPDMRFKHNKHKQKQVPYGRQVIGNSHTNYISHPRCKQCQGSIAGRCVKHGG